MIRKNRKNKKKNYRSSITTSLCTCVASMKRSQQDSSNVTHFDVRQSQVHRPFASGYVTLANIFLK